MLSVCNEPGGGIETMRRHKPKRRSSKKIAVKEHNYRLIKEAVLLARAYFEQPEAYCEEEVRKTVIEAEIAFHSPG
jgi:hypothetical protein